MESRDANSERLFRALVGLIRSCSAHIGNELALAAAILPLRCPGRDGHLARIDRARQRADSMLVIAEFILALSPSGPLEEITACGDHE